jgi:Protein of unknown function (DUF2950)
MIPRIQSLVLLAVAALALQSSLPANAQTPTPAKPETPAATTPPAPAPKPVVVQPKRFASPDEAVQAFVAALRAGDTKTLLAVLGSEGRPLVSSGDPVADRQSRETFLRAYDASSKLAPNGDRAVIQVGADDWPFPIPLVKQGERWRFDVRQGREEIIARRIGRNELYTMQTCLAYVDAQREYYSEDRNGDGVLEYAQRFDSTPGKLDGLYWPTQPGEPPSPLGELVVRARAAGYRREGAGPTPFHGYLYRILTAQGRSAQDGAHEYVLHGHMIAGFALVAFPAQYGVSGVMTFMVNHDGVVYQKDLGPSTRSIASAMRIFNPDGTWERADVPDAVALTNGTSR